MQDGYSEHMIDDYKTKVSKKKHELCSLKYQ